jgi:hypothetical protein
MKKILLLSSLLLLTLPALKAQIYIGKTCEISFFSSAPLENISAVNKTTRPVLNTTTNELIVKISVQGFKFDKPLMQEHFNENYMESKKYPHALFIGQINELIDYKVDGVYQITASGYFNIHGVDQKRTIEGMLTIKGGVITVQAIFNIELSDYNISVPKLLFQNIAESIEVKVNATLVPNPVN